MKIGVYIGTEADNPNQILHKQPWEQYLDGFNVDVYGSATLNSETAQHYNRISTTSRSPTNPLGKMWAAFADTREYLTQQDPDALLQLMHTKTHGPGVVLAATVYSVPVVTRISVDLFNSPKFFGGIRKQLLYLWHHGVCRTAFAKSDLTIVLGPEAKQYLQNWGVDDGEILVIPPEIDLPRFTDTYDSDIIREKLGLPMNHKIILYTGNLTARKGMDFLEEVIDTTLAKTHDPEITFCLVGEGPYRKKFRQKYDDNVILPGYVNHSEIDEYYKSSDLYLHPSQYEGIPLSITEAIECGIPVLARNAGDIDFILDTTFEEPELMAEQIILGEGYDGDLKSSYMDAASVNDMLRKKIAEM